MDRFLVLGLTLCLTVSLDEPVSADQSRGLTRVDGGEHRVALVIGNSDYQSGKLKNPVNDADDMSVKLSGLGFEVIHRDNLVTKQIGSTLRELRARLTPGSIALVFYAGHGLQIRGENYFPTVDAEITTEEDVPNQSLALRQVMDVLDNSKVRLSLIFLDACRNNPYARSFRSGAGGLAKVDAPSGTLIAYATRPGSVAADGVGRNGLYTAKLLSAMDIPDQPIELVLKHIVSVVKSESKGAQEPWMEGYIEGDFYFRTTHEPGDQGAVVAKVNPPMPVGKSAPQAGSPPASNPKESYLFGLNFAESLRSAGLSSEGVAMTQVDRGVADGLTGKTLSAPDRERLQSAAKAAKEKSASAITPEDSYLFGLNLGEQFSSVGLRTGSVAVSEFDRGVREGLAGKQASSEDKQQIQSFLKTQLEQFAARTKVASSEFLEKNRLQKDVTTTSSGLQYEILSIGDAKAASPTSTDKVTVRYRGQLIDGTEFDSSYARGQPATFVLSKVIKGWQEALALMKPGARWRIFLPPGLGSGSSPKPGIPAESVLIFDVELLSINR
jgi:FKBP-type peptidyl-prolyl cis-trans isomerase